MKKNENLKFTQVNNNQSMPIDLKINNHSLIKVVFIYSIFGYEKF